MNLLSVGVFAWSVLLVKASADQQIHSLFDTFSRTLANMNESFNEFASLMNLIPMNSLDQSVPLVTNIHQNTIQLVKGLCETVGPMVVENEGERSGKAEYDSQKLFKVESEKMESYSAGLLKDLKAIRKSFEGLTESTECKEKLVLPIGPPRVYLLYLQRSPESTNWNSNTTDLNHLVNNFMITVDGEVEALRYISRVLLVLSVGYDVTWDRKHDTVKQLIDSLIDSIKNIIIQEVHSAINEYNFDMNDISSISMMSVEPKIHAVALKESLITLSYYVGAPF